GVIGFGLVRHVESRKAGIVLSLSFLTGLPVSSLLVIVVDLLPIALTTGSVLAALALGAVVANLGWRERTRTGLRTLAPRAVSWRADAIVFCTVLALFGAVSLWQAVHLPVIPRDATVGMDLVAKYAAAEGTIRSSVFTGPELEGRLSNQPYYAPFVMLMQLTFRLAGFAFGKLWLPVLYLSFLLFLYARLRAELHAILAGFLLLVFVTVPLMFSYSYLVGTDLANAVFFGLGVLFLHDFLRHDRRRDLLLSGLFMGFACWSRSESILFVLPGALFLLGDRFRRRGTVAWAPAIVYLAAPAALFLLWHGFYYRLVFEAAPGAGVFSPGAAPRSWGETTVSVLMLLGEDSLYGGAFYVLGTAVLVNVVGFRERRGGWLLAWIPLLLAGFVVLVQTTPAASVENTVKRGIFKLFPILVVYVGESRLFLLISERLSRWESGREETLRPPPDLP
ncbi:MAG: hypothetical protein GF328_15185, partial [Candidatus Latescibacteria bacterium]|nr:hypothetical protein [Candidatus Latescibacterota bacterium]